MTAGLEGQTLGDSDSTSTGVSGATGSGIAQQAVIEVPKAKS